MNIVKYIGEVFSNSDLFQNIECEGTIQESNALERICDPKIPRKRLEMALAIIIDCIAEKFSDGRILDFLSDKTLNFLIDNRICLIDLGHLNLDDKWLQKIFETDNRCWEAQCTLEERRKGKKVI